MAFQDKVLLVQFRSSQWGRKRFDADISQEVANNHLMRVDASRFIKVLSLHPAVVKFSQHISRARVEHYKLTLPWSEGTRIIKASRFRDYDKIAQQWISTSEALYEEIYDAWPEIYEQARTDLNNTFNERDYPLRGQLRDKYRLRVVYQRMGAVNNWAVGLAEEEQRLLQAQAVEAYKDSVKAATVDLWGRLQERVRMLATALSTPEKRLTKPLIGGLRHVLQMIPELAVTEITPELKRQLSAAECELANLDLDGLKVDEEERKRKAQIAREQLNEITQNMQQLNYSM